MFASGRLTPHMTPRILHYLSQSPCMPTWAPDPAKGLAQHYISLQGLNRCIASLIMLGFALVHRPTALLVFGMLGRLSAAWEPQFLLCRCTCGFTCTSIECSDHGRTCWATRLCARCALAALATIQTALAIAHGDRLPRFIIIVQTLDDVTRKSPITFMVPLTLKFGCHLHYHIVLRHRSTQHRPVAAGLHCRAKSHRTVVQCTPCLSLVDDLPSASLFAVLRVNLRGVDHTFRQAYLIWR